MADAGRAPGPIAERAFDRGFKLAIAVGAVGVGLLYWLGVLSHSSGLHVTLTLVLFPVYLLSVATLLGVWLGYDTDERNLERIIEERDEESEEPSGRRRR
jgi:hypothetical protein